MKKSQELDEKLHTEAEENAETEATETETVAVEATDTAETSQTEETAEEISEAEGEEVTYKEMSPFRLVMRRFFRSKLSIVGLVMIAFLFIFAFFGPVVYRAWGESELDMTPSIDIVQESYTYKDESGEEITVVEVLEHEKTINTYANPSASHLFGTDDKGMDVFVRLMYGGRISLLIGFIVVILETVIGIVLGGLAGYFGGWVDQVIMRIVDIFSCIPTLPILLIASSVIDSWELTADQRIYVLMVIITVFSWSGTARMVRGQILSLREQEYITATEVMGLPTWRKIFKHLIPNVMPQLIVSMTLGLGSVILYESTLSYLGLGVQFPKAAWGSMIALVNDPMILHYHPNVWLPAGFLIVIAVLGFNFVGDGLRDAMDPKARK
ncbi:MAG: ABC transporter permease [Clostridia bacterium]|nr:ABC transporter permease [Clostridia bacterium]